ncbi:MAG: tripartite tricarboxylate transporter substrate binding protein [Rhodospirillaceae bacterium]|jgi:tripartite-type tricarboxylate transporter receptor subunit TctC|nr:tripartite tricarboxylate transporter substrate binding protein [Rhodospirillaceae bacterium]MBT5299478.1 tripartite tricarboxylate transporter substrate binding protein [Rhodospirillaceae bacterium]MBT5515342.1 tripartite tricarboxylate transporter substrate binding protein [Rhodospirillaceae bacterium]MBT6085468.1 tripartite tricarboxylate transporter substrate binding protein [Rhodospirillaceae bacterium]MBT6609526.1 tripartite tricarboxylate transporter substrate binding protein [Rhodosp
MFSTRRALTGIVAAFALTAIAGAASAEYPTKPITLVAPYGPGGASDLAARTVSATIPGYLGNGVLVVNRTGAAGVVGSTYVAKGKKDGYTVLLSRVGSQAAVPAINRKIPYKWDDFTFLGLLEKNPFVLCVNAGSPYKNFDDLIGAIKAGKKLKYATAGVGTLLHVAVIMLLDDLRLPANALTHIPFKGGGKAAAAVAGNHADIIFQNLSGVISHIQGKKLRAVAISTSKRAPTVPDVPTVAELGHPKLEAVVGWSGIWGPKGLPKEVVDKWVGSLEKLKKDKAWNKLTKGLGSIPSIMPPAETKAFVKNQYLAFKEVAERLGLVIK